MTYKSLLSIVRNTEADLAYLDYAVAMARQFEAHLDVICLGVDHVQVGFYYAGATAAVAADTLAIAEDEARRLRGVVEARLEKTDIRWSVEALVAQWGAIGPAVELAARHADLVILPKPYGEGRTAEDEAVLEAALFQGPTPAIVVPDGWKGQAWASNALIATNQGPEAMVAVRAALPGLQALTEAGIAIVEPPQHGPERSDPGGALSLYLARHGVKAEITILAKSMPKISDVLIRHIEDRGADLMIMGAYGHSRLREAVLGGPTRDMLADAPIPVLMAR